MIRYTVISDLRDIARPKSIVRGSDIHVEREVHQRPFECTNERDLYQDLLQLQVMCWSPFSWSSSARLWVLFKSNKDKNVLRTRRKTPEQNVFFKAVCVPICPRCETLKT